MTSKSPAICEICHTAGDMRGACVNCNRVMCAECQSETEPLDCGECGEPSPPTTCSLFVVVAFRYGGKENVFPIGVFSSRSVAQDAAKQHREYRGGKYDHRVYAFTIDKWDDNIGHQENNKPCIERNERKLERLVGRSVTQEKRINVLAARIKEVAKWTVGRGDFPHAYHCVQHGGSGACEKKNAQLGFKCPKCTPNAEPTRGSDPSPPTTC